MKIGHFFIKRPRFAVVISLVIVIVGMLAYLDLPVTQYPEIAPPTIIVRAAYPGASPEVISATVATPLEQEINGVDGMQYMTSQSTNDGQMSLAITFELGTDLDTAQVLVQNRVAIAEPRLPDDVRRLGVVTEKSSPDLMMVVHLESPDESLDQLYISNYALLNIRDVLARIDGIGNVSVFGAREYSMRIWLDPERLASLDLTATDVVAELKEQNVQVAGGVLGQQPMPLPSAFQLTVNTQGRFIDVEQFKKVIIKVGEGGRLTRLGDVARVELGARDYVTKSFLNGKPAVAIGIFQKPQSNALDTATEIRSTMDELSSKFPPGLNYRIVYNPTEFIEASVAAVYTTMFEAVILVVLVIILFLQSWRAAIIPILAIPVSLVGTFTVMAAFGFSLNNLTLFGLVLAIGIVVDDAIIVVENIQRNLADGMSAKAAASVTMDEVGSALVSMALVLIAVFIPTAFMGGITGQFFLQFAMTITVATVISAFNSLTLSPALGGILLADKGVAENRFGRAWQALFGPVFENFNRFFDAMARGYGKAVGHTVQRPLIALSVFLLLIGVTAIILQQVPLGFIPQQDQGYVIVAVELPKGASLQRTDIVVQRATELMQETPGVKNIIGIVGLSGATFSSSSNSAVMFAMLDPFHKRDPDTAAPMMVKSLAGILNQIQEANFFIIDPPPVRGLGRGGGFKMLVQDTSGRGLDMLEESTRELIQAANQAPGVERVYTQFGSDTPQYFLDINRTKAEMLNVPIENIFETLQVYLGSAYVNDINLYGRSYRVIAQADAQYRLQADNISSLRARSTSGAMVPIGSVARVQNTTGPDRVVRHNLFPAIEVQGNAAQGFSSGEALVKMEKLAKQLLPTGLAYEWTEIAFQEKQSVNIGLLVFPLSVFFVFLLLTAQYESWTLPTAVILIVPLCILFALLGVWFRGMDNNILTQIGIIVLIGLASKNAILIVEFAKQYEDKGKSLVNAVTEAAQVRLRPILMTSFAFILGVIPLVVADGAGAEMRQVLGTVVFTGMLGVTLSGLFFTPVFYVLIRKLVNSRQRLSHVKTGIARGYDQGQ
jgi:hydrophobic/amphiphilic exporter-1 (mainly G- bacteria), HAE1 family